MIHQQASCQLGDIRNWITDGPPIPDWVRTQMSGDIAPNGTFLFVRLVGKQFETMENCRLVPTVVETRIENFLGVFILESKG